MSRRPIFGVLVSRVFSSVPGRCCRASPQGGSPDHQKKLEELRNEAQKKGWTFEVGHTKAAEQPLSALAGTRVPAHIVKTLPKVAGDVNTRGAS